MLRFILLDETEIWDNTIKSFEKHDIYYFSGYVASLQEHGDGVPMLILYENEDIRAVNVVMKRDIGKDIRFLGKLDIDTYYDITTPYGYGGFLIEGNQDKLELELLEKEYTQYCRDNNIISEFVRFHPVVNNIQNLNEIYEIHRIGKTITLELSNKEETWNQLKGKNRNVIRKAIKNEVKIKFGLSQELIDNFIPLYNSTMDKDKASNYYYFSEKYYSYFLNELKSNTLIFYAMHEDRIIAMSIIIFANQQMHYHLSASDSSYLSLAPSNLLLLEVANWGIDNGFKTLHLGGGLGGNEDSLYKFKEAFNKNSTTSFSIGKKIFNPNKYQELISMRDINISNTTFFPLYRG